MAVEDLARWLGVQLDEDAAQALAALSGLGGPELGADWEYDGRYVSTVREWTMVAVGSQDFMEPTIGKHVAEWDPARVLREIDAKRRTLVRCQEELWSGTPRLVHFAKQTVREMAAVYADRPGYEDAVAAYE
jgi:hypothetical protein